VTDGWAWVIAAYLVVYGTLIAYAARLARRLSQVKRLLDGS
jgi:hypothetical protein